MFENQLEKLKALMPVVKAADSSRITGLFRFLVERVKNPDSYVVFLGETSCGKSSLINGIIDKPILPVSARPSTGTITEIVFSPEVTNITYYKCLMDGHLNELSADEFEKQTWKPDADAARLRVMVPSAGFLPGLRLFDTPGYNSIVEEHEEVLRDFLPNADAVIYTVGYKIGIQQEDFTFLRFLRELIGDDTPVVVAINRCPEGTTTDNRRIHEISNYITDIMGRRPEIFLIPAVTDVPDGMPILPKNDKLWRHIVGALNSTARQEKIAKAFDGYILDLFRQCDAIIKNRLAKAQMSEKEIKDLKDAQRQYADHLRKAVPELIEPAFTSLISKMPGKVEETADTVKNIIYQDIANSDRTDMNEEVGFINSHLMPFNIQKYGKEIINRYIDIELTDLNSRVDDYIQKETIKFNNRIAIQLQTCTSVAVSGLLSQSLGKIGSNGLSRYVVSFGGAGGANAGIANAASHLLKKTGDLVGKTFSRATHNQLKHTLAKIGATSMKRVGGAIAILAELLVFVVEMTTWKAKARGKVDKGLEKWKDETTPCIIKDLTKLKEQNISTLLQIADEQEHAFDDENPNEGLDLFTLQTQSDLADKWLNTFYKNV